MNGRTVNRDRRVEANPDQVCTECRGILRYYGHGGTGYLHVRVTSRQRGTFYATGHAVPVDQRHNPIRRTA
jgi:hypothetical protein